MERHFLCQGRSVRAHNPLTTHLWVHPCDPLEFLLIEISSRNPFHMITLFAFNQSNVTDTRRQRRYRPPLRMAGDILETNMEFCKVLIWWWRPPDWCLQIGQDSCSTQRWDWEATCLRDASLDPPGLSYGNSLLPFTIYLVSALTEKKSQLATSMTSGRYLIWLWSLTKHELVLEKDLLILIWSFELLICVCTRIDSPRWTSLCIFCPFFKKPTWASNREYSKCNDTLYSWTSLDAPNHIYKSTLHSFGWRKCRIIDKINT